MKKIKLFVATALMVSLLGATSYAAITTTPKGVQKLDTADIVDALNNNADVLDNHIDKIAASDSLGHVKIGTGLQVSEEGITNVDASYVLNLIYPAGSIYMSVNDVSPQNFIGGEWEALQDRFLIGAGGSYDANTTGGEETHVLTVAEMPSHGHTTAVFANVDTGYANYTKNLWIYGGGKVSTAFGTSQLTDLTGGGEAHNNMPPYLSVYMWKRIK